MDRLWRLTGNKPLGRNTSPDRRTLINVTAGNEQNFLCILHNYVTICNFR